MKPRVHVIGPLRAQFQHVALKADLPAGYDYVWHDKNKMPTVPSIGGHNILVLCIAWMDHKGQQRLLARGNNGFARVIVVRERGTSSLHRALCTQLPPLSPAT